MKFSICTKLMKIILILNKDEKIAEPKGEKINHIFFKKFLLS